MLLERERGEQRPSPRPEVLRGEILAQVLGEVVVQARGREVHELAVPPEAEEPRPVRQVEELGDAPGERLVPKPPPDEPPVLRAEAELDGVAVDGDVALRERGDAVRARPAGVPVGADAEPRLVDEPDRERARPFALVRPEAHVLRRLRAQPRQRGREREQALELRALLRRAEARVVEVLLAPGAVDARRLESRSRVRRDPDVRPGGRDRERADALELLLVVDRPAVGVDVAEAPAPEPAPAAAPSHAGR